MRKNILVLGAGRVGGAIALDLAGTHNVTIADISEKALQKVLLLNPTSGRLILDGSDLKRLKSVSESFDLIVNALPGSIGFSALKNCIECGKDVVDISFFSENPFDLYALAQEKGVKAVVDCGIAPGLSNMIAGYHFARMDVREFACYVGGLPKKRDSVFDYKAPFSPRDVISEYMRPARLVENGIVVEKEALSDVEVANVPEVGTLEAFNTDGLRTLLQTLKIPDMKEKTLRYPGHASQMRMLRDAGFFSDNPVRVGKQLVRPMNLSFELISPHWKLAPEEEEFTIMLVMVSGNEDKKETSYIYTIYDEYDAESGLSSMARTTGYTCSAVARLMLDGWLNKKTGIIAPEEIAMGPMGKFCFTTVLDYLKSKNIEITVQKMTAD